MRIPVDNFKRCDYILVQYEFESGQICERCDRTHVPFCRRLSGDGEDLTLQYAMLPGEVELMPCAEGTVSHGGWLLPWDNGIFYPRLRVRDGETGSNRVFDRFVQPHVFVTSLGDVLR